MKIEHFAINVAEPAAVAQWYYEHLGLTIVRQKKEPPFTTFLGDDSGQVLLEMYNNPPDEVPEYKIMNPLQLHLAFVSADPREDARRLMAAGASLVSDDVLDDGSHLIMLRDPWGLALQLCKRAVPMLSNP